MHGQASSVVTNLAKSCWHGLPAVVATASRLDELPDAISAAKSRGRAPSEEAKRLLAEQRQELDRWRRQLDHERVKFEKEKEEWKTRSYNAGYLAGREAERKHPGGGMSPPNVPVDTPGRARIQV